MKMKKILFYDAKPYDKVFFSQHSDKYRIEFIEPRLDKSTAVLAKGYDGVCAFVNDTIDKEVIDILSDCGITVLAMRCAGYSNVDIKAAYGKISVVRVPAYSPYTVAEHAMALLLSLDRKIHKAYNRTRDFNFNISGFTGILLHGKTVGVIGTGKIGLCFIELCRGFGMKVIAYDPYPLKDSDIDYVPLDELLKNSDIISLHCPLTNDTMHILDKHAFSLMKDGVFIINTSRGALIDTEALLDALNSGRIRGAGLDVYEEESELFYEDNSGEIITDDNLSLLLSKPNVLLTSHQAFLTEEALKAIADTTVKNLDQYFGGEALENEICYTCSDGRQNSTCKHSKTGRCF